MSYEAGHMVWKIERLMKRGQMNGRYLWWPSGVAQELGCTHLEAALGLKLADEWMGIVGRRGDGRFYLRDERERRKGQCDSWKEWIATEHGTNCADAVSLNVPLSQTEFLRNRLQAAFYAGYQAARK
jgi:hypothetical protein